MSAADDALRPRMEALLRQVTDLRQTSRNEDLSDHPDRKLMAVRTRLAAAIERWSPPNSEYREAISRANEQWGPASNFVVIELEGVLEALRDDYADGYLSTVEELIHGELFEDFLGMAEELQEKQFDAPAAVLAGSVLEEHMKKLAGKNGIALQTAAGRPRSLEDLGVSLVKAGAFPETQRKLIVGWYGIRNDAAHGRHQNVDHAEVLRIIGGIRDFAARFPA